MSESTATDKLMESLEDFTADRKVDALAMVSKLAGIMATRPVEQADMLAAFEEHGFSPETGADIFGVYLRASAGETLEKYQAEGWKGGSYAELGS